MLLALDCGNTQIVAGVYDGGQLVGNWRLVSDARRTEDEYLALLQVILQQEGIGVRDISDIIIASVVPDVEWTLQKLGRKHLKLDPLCLNSQTNSGLIILLTNPQELGADRIANAVAAHHIYGGDLIVVDFGTATTFDCVSAAAEYLGGAIVPGVGISRQALFQYAARLNNIPLEAPKRAIGRNTAECLQSGMMWGFGGQVDGLVTRMGAELPSKPTVIATGGYAALISPYSDCIGHVDPLLTLEGLRLIYARNANDFQLTVNNEQ
jgi:type III pantothenate kinase